MAAIAKMLSWLAAHLVVRHKNLNDGDQDAKPKPAVEVGIKIEF